MQMKESMQVSSLKLEGANEMTVYKRHGLHTKAQNPKNKVPHKNEPACTMVPASKDIRLMALLKASVHWQSVYYITRKCISYVAFQLYFVTTVYYWSRSNRKKIV